MLPSPTRPGVDGSFDVAVVMGTGLRARLDAIEAVPAIHSLLTTALGVAATVGVDEEGLMEYLRARRGSSAATPGRE